MHAVKDELGGRGVGRKDYSTWMVMNHALNLMGHDYTSEWQVLGLHHLKEYRIRDK